MCDGFGITGIPIALSYAPGFIFTTSLPPSTAAGARASIAYQREHLGDPRCSRWYAIDARAPAAVDGGSEVVKMNPGA
jgi:hypothetical protein